MKKVAIIFSNSPYGNNLGKEGLNMILSIACYAKKIGIFFIGDGIFQIFKNQNPTNILSKSYVSIFKMLDLYNINDFYLCYDSLLQRGFNINMNFYFNVHMCNFKKIKNKIRKFDILLNF